MLNLTVVVQAFFFGVAYYLMTIILIRPAVALVKKDNELLAKLNGEIQQVADRVASRTEHHAQTWQMLRQDLQDHKPRISYIFERIYSPSLERLPSLNKEELAQRIEAMKHTIVERVSHD
jgi:hypothetical protein